MHYLIRATIGNIKHIKPDSTAFNCFIVSMPIALRQEKNCF